MTTATTAAKPEKHDIVSLRPHRGDRDKFIVTRLKLHAPKHKYIGVKVNGQGQEYKLGDGTDMRILGKAQPTHRALRALAQRNGTRFGAEQPSDDYKKLVNSLLDALEQDNVAEAKAIGQALRHLN